jgi:NitT/TauT family transport system substrate-binding protein
MLRRSTRAVPLLTLWPVLLLGALVVNACGAATGATPAPQQTAAPVVLALPWVHTIEYAPFYMAQVQGEYTAAQIDLEFSGLGQSLPIDDVIAGSAQFGITSADNILMARANNKPIVAIATIYQRSPIAFISLAQQGIRKPEDLIGKKVTVDLDGTTGIIYRALLSARQIASNAVVTLPRTDFSNDALLNGTTDVMDAFINNQPVQLALQGHATNAILPSDYGIDVYANVIFTTEELIARDPELVQRFVSATLHGMRHVLDRPDQAVAETLRRGSELNTESETEALQRALPLINPANSRPGMMTTMRWDATRQMMIDQGLISSSVDVSKAYSLKFVEQAYR